MENKKPIIIGVVVLVMAFTAWVLVGKFKDLKTVKETNPPAVSELTETTKPAEEEAVVPVPPTSFDIDPVEGTITGINNDSLKLATGNGEETIRITPDHVIQVEGSDQEIKDITDPTTAPEIKEGTKVKINYTGPVTPETNIIASDANQGTVTAIDGNNLTIKMDVGEKAIEIAPSASIYLLEGEKAIDKGISDIKIGSLVTVAYADQTTKAVAVAIRIDKL